jgi:hypothetical protein
LDYFNPSILAPDLWLAKKKRNAISWRNNRGRKNKS